MQTSEDVGSKLEEETRSTPDINLVACWLALCPGAYIDEANVDDSDDRHIVIPVIGRNLANIKRDWDTWAGEAALLRRALNHLKDVKRLIHNR